MDRKSRTCYRHLGTRKQKKHYEWITEPSGKLPAPPAWLLTIWSQFKEKFEVQFKMACPWANAEEVYEKKAVNSAPVYNGDTGGFSNVVSEFNPFC